LSSNNRQIGVRESEAPCPRIRRTSTSGGAWSCCSVEDYRCRRCSGTSASGSPWRCRRQLQVTGGGEFLAWPRGVFAADAWSPRGLVFDQARHTWEATRRRQSRDGAGHWRAAAFLRCRGMGEPPADAGSLEDGARRIRRDQGRAAIPRGDTQP
jgi:hypothetical protein